MLDVFKQDAFGIVSLTESVNLLPYKPGRLGAMGLFQRKSLTQPVAVIEMKNGRLALIQTAARGTMPNVWSRDTKNARAFTVPHIPLNADVEAVDVEGVRAFGSEDRVEAMSDIINENLETMKQSLEVTIEYHRIGAIQGNVLDADGSSTLFNWFTEFSIVETEVEFDLTSTTTDTKTLAQEVIRNVETALGATPYDHVHAICGDQFWDDFVSHESVKAAFDRWNNGQFLRETQRSGFEYANIVWENYRGSVGNVPFIADDDCRFFPVGAPQLFTEAYAPAPFIETINTPGKQFYAKQEAKKWNLEIGRAHV